ncbi:helix-turn-helix domain-containing protein [Anaerostipes sp.]|uniref:helix-turn-helix domain-containing protein n=1 Tax=Anaerostipes sp. TaxID=1872530 RepID=UPI0025C2B925|nr:helix-turn-helix transcriptional regulator [Anaerostipes sp.]MBS7009992.1 helix-turn-helix transcriptional regulator [Anaerostipes sp.]
MEKDTYDRKAVGKRIREKRRQLGITMKEAAEKLGRVPTYYADIERGNCGMSVETMIAISRLYHMSLDYLILGKEEGEQAGAEKKMERTEETEAVYQLLNNVSKRERMYAAKVLRTFLIACSDVGAKEETLQMDGDGQ